MFLWNPNARYTPGDKSCSNMSRRHFAATNRLVCPGELLWKSLSLQQNFVAAKRPPILFCFSFATYYRNKILSQRQGFSQKFSGTNEAICRRDGLLQLVVRPAHTEWSVANLSHGVFTPTSFSGSSPTRPPGRERVEQEWSLEMRSKTHWSQLKVKWTKISTFFILVQF